MGQKVSEERARAVRLAIDQVRQEWRQEHPAEKKGPSTVLQGKWFGVTQQKISEYNHTGVVGQKLADGVAEYLETTIDGLIHVFLREGDPVRAGDIKGWARAVEEARARAGAMSEALNWSAAAEVILPVAPAVATHEFAYDLAHLLAKHVRVSGVMKRVARGR